MLVAEQVRRLIETGIADLGDLAPAADAAILLWIQHHPDGPDWAVPAWQYMEWAGRQPDRESLPTLSVLVNMAQGTVALIADHGCRKITSTVTFRMAEDRSDRSQVVAAAAQRYVDLAATLFDRPPAS